MSGIIFCWVPLPFQKFQSKWNVHPRKLTYPRKIADARRSFPFEIILGGHVNFRVSMFIWFLQSHYPCSRPKSSKNQWLEITLGKKRVNIAMYLILVKKPYGFYSPPLSQDLSKRPAISCSFLAWITTKAFCQEEFNIPHLGKVATTRSSVFTVGAWLIRKKHMQLRILKEYVYILGAAPSQ